MNWILSFNSLSCSLELFLFMHNTVKCDFRIWSECSQYISITVYNTVLVIHFSCQLHEWVGKIVKATLNLALVMCLSLWAYYIQIKGEFTDRRQAPAPISNQTVPSGEPCGAHICGHSLTAWHHGVLQESSTRIMGSCERECSTLNEHWVMYFKIMLCIYEHWRNMSWFILCSHCSMRTSRKRREGGRGHAHVLSSAFLKAHTLQGSTSLCSKAFLKVYL